MTGAYPCYAKCLPESRCWCTEERTRKRQRWEGCQLDTLTNSHAQTHIHITKWQLYVPTIIVCMSEWMAQWLKCMYSTLLQCETLWVSVLPVVCLYQCSVVFSPTGESFSMQPLGHFLPNSGIQCAFMYVPCVCVCACMLFQCIYRYIICPLTTWYILYVHQSGTYKSSSQLE